VTNLDTIQENEMIDDGNAPYYITLKELINDFGTNSDDGIDLLQLTVYSDYLEKAYRFMNDITFDMFKA
jgi:hypothetical protein